MTVSSVSHGDASKVTALILDCHSQELLLEKFNDTSSKVDWPVRVSEL